MTILSYDFKSENIKHGDFDADSGVLEVTFKNGAKARYGKFTDGDWDAWTKAESAGRWFHLNVKSRPREHPLLGAPVVLDKPAPIEPASLVDEEIVSPPDKPTTLGDVVIATVGGEAPAAGATSIKVDEAACTDAIRDVARSLYVAYVDNADGKNYQGLPCPAWNELTSAVRSHWCAAALHGLSNGLPLLTQGATEELERVRGENDDLRSTVAELHRSVSHQAQTTPSAPRGARPAKPWEARRLAVEARRAEDAKKNDGG